MTHPVLQLWQFASHSIRALRLLFSFNGRLFVYLFKDTSALGTAGEIPCSPGLPSSWLPLVPTHRTLISVQSAPYLASGHTGLSPVVFNQSGQPTVLHSDWSRVVRVTHLWPVTHKGVGAIPFLRKKKMTGTHGDKFFGLSCFSFRVKRRCFETQQPSCNNEEQSWRS